MEALELMGHVSGVMDDRGKYIYISASVRRCYPTAPERRGALVAMRVD